jgi:hypothetical protein
MNKNLQKAWLNLALTTLVLCGFAVSSQAQLNTIWERTARSGAEEPAPDWLVAGFVRGMSYGVVNGNERVYAADRTNTRIRVMDAETGADVELGTDFDMTGVAGGLFLLNDVAVSTDGKIFLGNLTTDASVAGNPFKFYMWNGEGGMFASSDSIVSTTVERMGDKFTVFGSVEDNTAEIWVPVQASNPGRIYVFTTSDEGSTWDQSEITLTGTNVIIPSNASVARLGTGGAADFYIAGNGSSPKRYASDGSFVTGSVVTGTTGRNGIEHFSIGTSDFLSVYTYNPDDGSHTRRTGYVIVYDVTDAENVVKVTESPLMGDDVDTFSSTHGEANVRLNDDDTYNIYALDGVNGFAAFTNAEIAGPPGLFTDYFDYGVDAFLSDHGWNVHSGGTTNAIFVADQTLVYDGYAGSNQGLVASLTVSGQDVHRSIGTYTEGSVFAAALVNVSSATETGDYFLHFGPEPMGNIYRGRVYVKRDTNNNLAFGVSKSGNAEAADYTDFIYSMNQPVLLVLEYVFGEAGTHVANLYVNPIGSEKPAVPGASDTEGTELDNLTNIALRQGGAAASATLVIGGLRAGSDYAEVVGDPLAPPIPTEFITNLAGLNEVPPNTSEGTGTVTAQIVNDELIVSGSFAGLGGDYTMSHIHTGAAGVSGGVVFTLTATVDPDQKGGMYEAVDNTFAISPEQMAALGAGTYYVNIHTSDLPAGEIRGQLLEDPNENAPAASAITAPADGAQVTLEGLRNSLFTASWSAAADDDGHAVAYVWQLSASSDFSDLEIITGTGGNTSVSFTYEAVDALLDAAGVPESGTITLYHRVISTDGSLFTTGDAASVEITRGELVDAITIAEALETEDGSIVTVDAYVTRALGRESRLQDSTAAMGTFASSGSYFDAIADGSVRQGDFIRITGRRTAFFNLDQIDQISEFEVITRDNTLPEPALVTLAEIRDNGEAYKSQLVRVEDITINPDGDELFSAGIGLGNTYLITDATVTEEAVVDFRIPNQVNTNIVGTPIPTGPFTFEGVLGVYLSTFQLYAVNASDVIRPDGPLAGTFHIPQGFNAQGFESLAEAIEAVNEFGLAGHATILIDEDLDEGDAPLRINRGDLSEDARLTIKPAPGKQVTISTGDFRLVDTGYITIDGSSGEDDTRDLTFEKNAESAGFIGLLSNTVSVDLMNFNVTYTDEFGAATYAILINRRESGDDSGFADNVLVENVKVGTEEKPFNDAIWFLGSPSLPQFFHQDVTFSGNEFHVFRSGLRTQTHTNTVVTGNVVYNYGAGDSSLEAFRLNTPVETFIFTNNEIVFVGTDRTEATTFVGLEATNSLVSTVQVFNNTISFAGFTGEGSDHSFFGFRHNGVVSTAEFQLYHNTIRFGETGQSGVHAAIGKNTGASGDASVDVQNNIIVNDRDAENSYAYQWTGSGFSADNNNIVTTGEGGVALFDETRYADLMEFSGATSNDVNSTDAEVEFVSNTDLRLTGASIGDDRLGGAPLAAVTTDIDGKERSNARPYKGAYEGEVALTPALEAIGPFALLSPSDAISLVIQGDPGTEVEIVWEMPESSEAWARMGGTLENDPFAHGGDGSNAQGKYLGMVPGQEAWIRSPKVVNPGVLSFWGATFSSATTLTLAVEISEDGEDWEELAAYSAVAGDAGDITSVWQNKEIEVNREGAFYFRWRQHGGTVAGAAYIDDVELSIMGTTSVIAEDFEGWESFRELLFVWHVDLPGNDFSEPALSIPSDENGRSNMLTLTFGAIDAALAGLGVESGASVNLQWTVTAGFGESVRFADSPFAITITRSELVSTGRTELPLVFSLSQNYPNPFNPSTNIKFTLPEAVDVRLEVYNIAGQRVATLVNNQMTAGEHIVAFDGRALASGVYIYRIIAGEYMKSHKMTLIK